MAFLKNRLLSPEEQKNLLKIMNNEQPLSDDVKKRLKKLNDQLDTILKGQKKIMEFENYINEFLEFTSNYFTKEQIETLKENLDENFGIYDENYFYHYLYGEYSDKSFEDIDNNEFEKTGFYKSKDGKFIIEQQIF